MLCEICGLSLDAAIHDAGSGHAEAHPWSPRGNVSKETSAVNHPKHYNAHPAGIECIDVIEHMTLNVGNAVKYCWRAGLKAGAEHKEDLEKAIWYIQREIKRVGKATAPK